MDNTIRITNIQHFSVHDGPGVRTTVFTKGCNLKCQWCHNPETIQAKPQISYNEELCIGCGMCTQICPEHHRFDVQNGRHIYERKDCKVCEKCAEQCPTNALSVYGVSKTVEEIVEEAYRDSMVFPEFGGVTFSGGECLLQAKNIKKTAEILKQRGIHICIDTALNVAWDTIEGILPYTDLFLVDVKAGTEDTHRKYTGVTNRMIKENLQKKSCSQCRIATGAAFLMHSYYEELDEIIKYISSLGDGVKKIQLLKYHSLGKMKYQWIGKECVKFEEPDEVHREYILSRMRKLPFYVEWN
mgnify:CR=1 FL=1